MYVCVCVCVWVGGCVGTYIYIHIHTLKSVVICFQYVVIGFDLLNTLAVRNKKF